MEQHHALKICEGLYTEAYRRAALQY